MSKEHFDKFKAGAVMDHQLQPLVSKGMYKAIIAHTNNYSAYIRGLVMKDLGIDEYGNKVNKAK